MDLGFAMARRWWRPLWGAWAALVVPAQLGLFLLLRQAPGLALLLCWWLLPLWERVPLFVVSRALFGVVPTVRQAAAGLWSVGWAGLVADLSWRRLSPIRTVVLSVSLLERLAGSRAAHRRRVLSQQVRVVGMGLAFASLLFEAGVIAGLLVLAGWCLPEGPRWSSEVLWDELLAGRGWAVATLATFTVAVLGLVQPLRTCAAFSLYLQRRTVLEGWDVELSFRRLAARIASRAGGVAALLLLALGLAGGPVRAAPAPAPERVEQVTAEVLARPEFGGTSTQTRWKLRLEFPASSEVKPREPGLELPVGGLASLVQALLLGLAGLAVVGLLLSLVGRRLPALAPRGAELPPPPLRAGLLGLDGLALPEHPAQAAWALWQAGRQEAALALLYRAAVAHLVHTRDLEIDDSATEGDCLRAVRRHLPGPPAAYLGRLTRAWQRRAYAHRGVDEAEMRALVEGWPELDRGAA